MSEPCKNFKGGIGKDRDAILCDNVRIQFESNSINTAAEVASFYYIQNCSKKNSFKTCKKVNS